MKGYNALLQETSLRKLTKDSTVRYYRLEESSTPLVDQIYGKDLSLVTGTATLEYQQTGVNNYGIKISSDTTSSSRYFYSTDLQYLSNTQGSASLWVKGNISHSTTQYIHIFETNRTRPSKTIILYFYGNSSGNLNVAYTVNNIGTLYSGFGRNTWNHLVVTWSETRLEGYRNGVQILSRTFMPDDYTGGISLSDVIVGNTNSRPGYEVTIDEAAYFSRILTPYEVYLLYNRGKGIYY